MKWWVWYAANFKNRSRRDAQRVMALARSDDPGAAAEEERAKNRAAVAAHRKRAGEAEPQPGGTTYSKSQEYRLTEDDYAAQIVRDVEAEIANLENVVDDPDLLRELILQKLALAFKDGEGVERSAAAIESSPERTGRAPKCAVPMYVPEPFKKVIRKFTAPDGRVHKIEFLCDGQQFVVAGTHPDTGSPYTWRDRDLMRTSLMELPVVCESDIEALLQRCAEELKVKLGWIDNSIVAPDSSGADPNNIVQFTPIAERAEKMQYGGEYPINDTLLVYREALPSSLLKKWRAIEFAGGTPHFQKRRFWGVEDKGPDDPISDVEAIPTIEPPKPSAPFVLRPRGIIDPAAIPPRRWLGGGQFYQRRTVSTTIAPGDTGKTTLGMVEGVSMQTGRCLLGDFPDEKLRIWIHNGEDSRDELDRKLAAVCLFNNIPLSEVADIFLTTASDIPLRVASGYSEIVPDKPLIKCIHEQIGDNKIDVAMFDPLITLHGVPESDNGKMDQVIRIFAAIADARNCSVSLAQHVRKGPAGEDYDYRVEDARGASAVRDATILNDLLATQPIAHPNLRAGNIWLVRNGRSAFFVWLATGLRTPASLVAQSIWRR